jgi:CBS domain-containing protein
VLPPASVFDAIEMTYRRARAPGSNPGVSVLSQRDLRAGHPQGQVVAGESCRRIMSSPVTSVTPDATLDECMTLMTAKRIRHLQC